MGQRGEITFGTVCFYLFAAALAYGAYYFLPPYFVRYKMDGIVIEALYQWRDRNDERRAGDYLREQIEAKNFPAYLQEKNCKTRQQGLFRHLECEWQVLVKDPVFKKTHLKFKVYKYLNAEGLLEDVE